MTTSRVLWVTMAACLLIGPAAHAQPAAPKPNDGSAPEGIAKPDKPSEPAGVKKLAPFNAVPRGYVKALKDGRYVVIARLPITHLHPSHVVPNLCVLAYRITTDSPECQQHFDQGLGYFYSYVWMEAARSFETALQY